MKISVSFEADLVEADQLLEIFKRKMTTAAFLLADKGLEVLKELKSVPKKK